MEIAHKWKDYEILDMSNGEKLERWGKYILVRPDPQIIWTKETDKNNWNKADAIYNRSNKGGGEWTFKNNLPKSWKINYERLTFNIKPMGFKHTGLFPEQAVNWDWMIDKIQKSKRPIKVLNLFAYTGGASVACLYAGASVCHVDSSKGMIEWAKENVKSSNLEEKSIRYIVDDVIKFVKREIRRQSKYDVIIMDPPSYGRGKSGEVWNFEENISELIDLCIKLLSDKPLFLLINSYTTGTSSKTLENILKLNIINKKGKFSSGEIGLPMSNSEITLPCGIFARWENI
jgi:23S rRNA (cytosine1962-C5)-methyltransferase